MRLEKKAIVEELQGVLKPSKFVFLVDCRGMSVEIFDGLRGELRKCGGSLRVVSNSFFKHAAAGLKYDPDVQRFLEGPTAVIVGSGDVTVTAKTLKNHIKATQFPIIKGGLLEGRVILAKDVEAMAALPSREVLLSQFVGTVAAPLSRLVGVFSQKLSSLVYVLRAIEEKKKG